MGRPIKVKAIMHSNTTHQVKRRDDIQNEMAEDTQPGTKRKGYHARSLSQNQESSPKITNEQNINHSMTAKFPPAAQPDEPVDDPALLTQSMKIVFIKSEDLEPLENASEQFRKSLAAN
jgi:hypothetical protein